MVRNQCGYRGTQTGRGGPAREGIVLASDSRQHSWVVATTGGMGEVEFLNRQNLDYLGKQVRSSRIRPSSMPFIVMTFIASSSPG